MAVTAKAYGLFAKSLAEKKVDLGSDNLKVMLCSVAYTPDQDAHQFKSQVTGEVTGTGYTAGGQLLTGVSLSYDPATNTVKLDADDPSWPSSTITARYAVFYDDTPSTAATKPLIAYVDFGADIATTAGAFTLTLDANGIVRLSAA